MNRLKETRLFLGLTQQELADKTEEKRYRINDMESGKTKIQVDFAELLEEKFNINAWWLLTGKGSMHTSVEPVTSVRTEPVEVPSSNTISVPLITSHKASAGRGNSLNGIDYEVVETMSISKSLFKTPPTANVKIIKVDGDSMIPMLYPESYCIFEECNKFKTDGLYIINYDNELMVKLLQIDLKENKINFISKNKEYKSWELSLSEYDNQSHFAIIGKVLRIII